MQESGKGPALTRRSTMLALGAAASGLGGAALAQTAEPPEALVKAAQAEREIVLYTGATANIIDRLSAAFGARYGIKISFLRLGGGPLLQRYSAEAEVGNIAADIIFVAGGGNQFAAAAFPKGWIEPPADLPVVQSGVFPKRFMRAASAIIQLGPWVITYNTDKLREQDAPKDWPDLLAPRFKGQILMPELASTDAVVQFWAAIADKYGIEYLTRIRDQQPRWFADAVPSLQALAAGEGMVQIPITGQAISAVVAKGAPVGTVTPDYTTGVEMQLMLTARGKAKHPNAARLLANFVMSPEGNKIFNADKGSASVYDPDNLPKHYVSPQADVTGRRAELAKALGK